MEYESFVDVSVVEEETTRLANEEEQSSSSLQPNSVTKSNTELLKSLKREVPDFIDGDDIDVSVLHEDVDLGRSVIDDEGDFKLPGLVDSVPAGSASGSRENLALNNSFCSGASPLLEDGRPSDAEAEMDLDRTEFGNTGSDMDDDDIESDDVLLRQRNAMEFPAEVTSIEDPTTADMDFNADVALRTFASSEVDLNFDWQGDPQNFEGVREVFTGPSGPTFDVSGLTPLEIFKQIWDADIIAHIVRETNRFAHQLMENLASNKSRLHRWKDTTEEEIWRFFGIIMLQSFVVNNVEREYWYPKLESLRIGAFGDIMSFNRFCLLKRCLHFVDNTQLTQYPTKLDKIMSIIEHLNNKFSSLYLPEQNVAIDESLLLWKGLLSFAQLIAKKKARIVIKSYELCESRTGYLWKMEVYSGKEHAHMPQESTQHLEVGDDEPESATCQIVYSLMRPLFDRGHTLVMDNFYNAPLLSRLLKVKHKTDTMGTLRLNREFVPESLKLKNKKNMRSGEVCFSSTKDLSVFVWMDKNVVSMISTFHDVKIGGNEKYGYYKYKPQVVLDYNLSMGGLDHRDQMLHAFPIERVRNIIWYKKLFRRLLNVSIHNAFVIFTHNHTQIGNRDFRLQLVDEIIKIYQPPTLARPLPQTPSTRSSSTGMHLPSKNAKVQRCKLCAAAKLRRTTIYRCSTCQVNLCMDACYVAYHRQLLNSS